MDLSHLQDTAFDLNAAREIAESFTQACGANCQLLDHDGQVLYRSRLCGDSCAFCRRIAQLTGQTSHCEKVHLYGAYQAERFGGRYIYFCPSGMAYFAAPIIIGGRAAGSLVGGPVLIMDIDDYLAGSPPGMRDVPAELLEEFRPVLESFPRIEPARLSHLSNLLFALSVYISDSSCTLLLNRERDQQQQVLSEHIQQLKLDGAPTVYPIEKERELVHAIREGDQTAARRLLNEILGHILFSTGGEFTVMRARALELMVVLSRAAAEGGVDIEQVFGLNYRYLAEISHLRSTDDLIFWLTRIMERFADLVFNLVDIKHKDIIYKAIDFMKKRYQSKVTLEDTALYVGLSPPYFSKVFKEEMGCTFNHYLNELRINKSKSLLLSGNATLVEICSQSGFEDQSYFTKVFKKRTGVTPGKFRERRGRLEPDKERSAD